MAVGDVNSTALGSGARYNDGKPAMELLPVSDWARYYHRTLGPKATQKQVRAVDALLMLGLWQETGDAAALYKALERMDDDGGVIFTECANVFTYGKRKYAEWNWAKGMAWSIPLACAARHLRKIIELGEMDDGESGLPHRGHFACNVFMLLTFMRTYPEGDDRPRNLITRELKNAA
jgi:hypothetical protein